MQKLVRVDRDGDVLIVTMANGARRNALDLEMTQQLASALQIPPDVSAVVLLGEGNHFSVGGDVRAFAAADDTPALVATLAATLHRVIRAMRSTPVPVVAGVRGWAAGAGMSLVLAADTVVAGRSAMLRPAYTKIGLTPDGGMTWTLPRMVGQSLARSILLGNQVVTAAHGYDIGLVDDIVADEVVDQQAVAYAHGLAEGAVGALSGVKRLLLDGASRTLDEQLDAEAASITLRAGSAEAAEGIAAFVEHRDPDFAGRRAMTPR